MSGFVAYMRSSEASELRKQDPNGFLLLSLIAERARWKAEVCPVTGRKQGEALIGDYKEAGIKTREQYRGAARRLQEAGFITIKTTNKGTVATLTDSSVWSIAPDFATISPTSEQPSNNHPATTKEQGNTGKHGNTPPKSPRGDWKPSENQTRLNRLFKRRDSTKWSDKELRAFKKIDFTEEDLSSIENYYSDRNWREPSSDYRRKSLETLLNNWTGELDRANRQDRRHESTINADGSRQSRVGGRTGKEHRLEDIETDPEMKLEP